MGRWTMPDWMAPYLPLLSEKSGRRKEEVEHAMNCGGRSTVCLMIYDRVSLLERLHRDGFLTPLPDEGAA